MARVGGQWRTDVVCLGRPSWRRGRRRWGARRAGGRASTSSVSDPDHSGGAVRPSMGYEPPPPSPGGRGTPRGCQAHSAPAGYTLPALITQVSQGERVTRPTSVGNL